MLAEKKSQIPLVDIANRSIVLKPYSPYSYTIKTKSIVYFVNFIGRPLKFKHFISIELYRASKFKKVEEQQVKEIIY